MEQDGFGTVIPHTSSNRSQLLFNKKPYDELTEDQRQNINQVEYTTGYDAAMPSRMTAPMIATVDRYMLIPPTQLTSSSSASSQSQALETPATPETGNIDDSPLD